MSNVSEKVMWNRVSVPDVIAMRIGTEDQVCKHSSGKSSSQIMLS